MVKGAKRSADGQWCHGAMMRARLTLETDVGVWVELSGSQFSILDSLVVVVANDLIPFVVHEGWILVEDIAPYASVVDSLTMAFGQMMRPAGRSARSECRTFL